MRLLFLFLTLIPFLSSAQNESVVLYFEAEEFNSNVRLNWTISQGNTCNGIDLFRSSDGINYTKIGNIEGICGSTSASTDYSFTDLFPEKNSLNYYRLGLGGFGYSYIVQIEIIDIGPNTYQIRPQPINENGVLLFKNDSGKTAELKVYNTQGNIVGEYSTNDEKFELEELIRLPGGLYHFNLTVNDREIKGKIEIP